MHRVGGNHRWFTSGIPRPGPFREYGRLQVVQVIPVSDAGKTAWRVAGSNFGAGIDDSHGNVTRLLPVRIQTTRTPRGDPAVCRARGTGTRIVPSNAGKGFIDVDEGGPCPSLALRPGAWCCNGNWPVVCPRPWHWRHGVRLLMLYNDGRAKLSVSTMNIRRCPFVTMVEGLV